MSSSPGHDRLYASDPEQGFSPWPGLSRQDNFFEDDGLKRLIARGQAYVETGAPLHLSGPAGLGKTTIALRIAETIGRPVEFMAGNQWLEASDFIGREIGKTTRTVVDKYIQSVRRTDAHERKDWRQATLALAMRKGNVLVYDEFTRATPQANAVLLSVLEEGVLVTADPAVRGSVIEAHPEFRIILTSNPHDYVGVNGAPDALLDRMITLPIAQPGDDTIRGIMMHRTGVDEETAGRILSEVARHGHGDGSRLRATLMIARIVAHMARMGPISAEVLGQIASDVVQGRRRAMSGIAPISRKEAS